MMKKWMPAMLAVLIMTAVFSSCALADAYSPVLDAWYDALATNVGSAEMQNRGLCGMAADCGSDPLYSVGYQMTDLDGDGSSELLIGSMTGDSFYGKLVFAVYSQNGYFAGNVLMSSERNRYYYLGGNLFANVGSNSWDSSVDTTLQYTNRSLTDLGYATPAYRYVQADLMPMAYWKQSVPTATYVPAQPTMAPLGYSRWVNGLTSDRVHLRTNPGSSSQSMGLYFTGCDVQVIRDQGNGWSLVTIGNETGYMMTKYLTSSYVYSRMPVGYVRGSGYVNLRSSATQQASVLERLNNGTGVTVMGETRTGWYYVIAPDGTRGYMMADLVSVSY